MPGWDEAEHLTNALEYWDFWQHPHLLNPHWWQKMWGLSDKFPPLTYLATGPLFSWAGAGIDQGILINAGAAAVLLLCTYGLGERLFNPGVGLGGAVLCVILPGLYNVRLDYLLDYPLAAGVSAGFLGLTLWRQSRPGWGWAGGFGLALGIALLVKETALFFLLVPSLAVAGRDLVRGAWRRLGQLGLAFGLAYLVAGPWYRTNWLLILTASKRATIDSALAEGKPGLGTWEAWTYYLVHLPEQVSWLLLIGAGVGLVLRARRQSPGPPRSTWAWLGLFLGAAYLLNTLNIDHDNRYAVPYLPEVALILAWALGGWPRAWRILGCLSLGLMALNLFPPYLPLTNQFTQVLSPGMVHPVYWGPPWPHAQVIRLIQDWEPYRRNTLGVLPSTGSVNQRSLSLYGALADFQVYGRQVGTETSQVPADLASLDWFLTKSGSQGSIRGAMAPAEAAMNQAVLHSRELVRVKTWPLDDQSDLSLYHRSIPRVQIVPLAKPLEQVRLEQVEVPAVAPAGEPLPVTYQWSAPGKALGEGLVLLTWQGEKGAWNHDHGLGMGEIMTAPATAMVLEHTATLPPPDLPEGVYHLQGQYLNRTTGQVSPLPVPPTQVVIRSGVPAQPSPPLDLVTQLLQLAKELPAGERGLAKIFPEIARINQYDPRLDYAAQAQSALTYRLAHDPHYLDQVYALALACILQREVTPAVQALEMATQLDPQNPNPYLYLAFVHLYNLSPLAARAPLARALALAPGSRTAHLLQGVDNLMQGNLWGAWGSIYRPS